MPDNRARHRQLLAQLDRLTPEIRREVERALGVLQRRMSIGEIVDALRTGSPARLMAVVSRMAHEFREAAQVVVQAFQAGAVTSISQLTLTTSLRLTSPHMVAAAETSAAQLVTSVTEATRHGIRTIIARAFADGIAPRDAAAVIRPLIGLNARQAEAVLALRRRLIDRGLAHAQIRDRMARYSNKLLRQRALLIARTEIIRASTDGQIATWREAQRRGFLPPGARKRWLVTDDDRLCPRCQRMSGRTAPIEGVFTDGAVQVIGPPLHPACRCTVVIDRDSLALRPAA